MEITFLGHASFKLKGKNSSLVTDPYGDLAGIKFPKTDADIVTVSHQHGDHNGVELVSGEPFVISGPGEYEVKGIKVSGVDSFHDTKRGSERGKNTIFKIKVDDLQVCHLGDLGQDELTSEQIDALGDIDIVLVPCGGVYTIDASAAAKIATSLEPKMVIPMHFKDPESSLGIEGVDKFLKEMGKEKLEPLPKLVITKDKLPEELTVVLLEKKG